MPWYRNGHSVPVIYKTSKWWVDWHFEQDQQGFDTWREAMDFALSSIHPESESY